MTNQTLSGQRLELLWMVLSIVFLYMINLLGISKLRIVRSKSLLPPANHSAVEAPSSVGGGPNDSADEGALILDVANTESDGQFGSVIAAGAGLPLNPNNSDTDGTIIVPILAPIAALAVAPIQPLWDIPPSPILTRLTNEIANAPWRHAGQNPPLLDDQPYTYLVLFNLPPRLPVYVAFIDNNDPKLRCLICNHTTVKQRDYFEAIDHQKFVHHRDRSQQ